MATLADPAAGGAGAAPTASSAACATSLAACERALADHFAAAAVAGAPLWLFGYASLVWKPEGSFSRRAGACLGGYCRRFYQASPDHRGTPDAMGRVATIVRAKRPSAAAIAAAGAACALTRAALAAWPAAAEGAGEGEGEEEEEEEVLEGEAPVVHGVAYCLEGASAAEHLAKLCKRECGGYVARSVRVTLETGEEVLASTFVGERGGEFFRKESPRETAAVIVRARGASGANLAYLLNLHAALAQVLGVTDAYLERLVALTGELGGT